MFGSSSAGILGPRSHSRPMMIIFRGPDQVRMLQILGNRSSNGISENVTIRSVKKIFHRAFEAITEITQIRNFILVRPASC
jgi:hypothetical protein